MSSRSEFSPLTPGCFVSIHSFTIARLQTPGDLISTGLYARIAVAFHPKPHRLVSYSRPLNTLAHFKKQSWTLQIALQVSYRLLAKELGATRSRLREVLAQRMEARVLSKFRQSSTSYATRPSWRARLALNRTFALLFLSLPSFRIIPRRSWRQRNVNPRQSLRQRRWVCS